MTPGRIGRSAAITTTTTTPRRYVASSGIPASATAKPQTDTESFKEAESGGPAAPGSGTETANTPWGIRSTSQSEKFENTISHALDGDLDEKRKAWVHRRLKDIAHNNFERQAWYQLDKFISAWVWSCPKEHCRLNDIQFPIVVAQTYFGVRRECLRRLKGQTIHQKSEGGRDDIVTRCDPYGDNLVKASLPRSS
jgi:hypothetical protein